MDNLSVFTEVAVRDLLKASGSGSGRIPSEELMQIVRASNREYCPFSSDNNLGNYERSLQLEV